MWIGLLFSVLGISSILQQKDRTAPGQFPTGPQEYAPDTFRTATIHCLNAGDYLQQSRYTLETMALLFALDHNYNTDASIYNWVLLGVLIRIAMRMGLHRDPSHWPSIRPLQAEHRRRLWTIMYQMDFLTSTGFGLPRNINDSQCDTRTPAHLFEGDLNPEDNELPQERSLNEPTPLLFIIQRNHILKVAAEIYDATEAGPPSPATVALLNAKIQRVIEATPTWLKYRPLEASVGENTATLLQQMFYDIFVHKAVYLLHRRSFVGGSGGEESARSNEICINAALAILEHQRRMSEETQCGGRMATVRWKLSSSLNHEFLQATMMLCYALSRPDNKNAATNSAKEDTLCRRTDIVEALTIARAEWERISDQSVDARRAAKAIAVVLQQDSDTPNARATQPAVGGDSSHGFEPYMSVDSASWPGLFNQIPAIPEPNYFGTFDYGQDVALDALDPSVFMVDQDPAAFGNMLDGFAAGHSNM